MGSKVYLRNCVDTKRINVTREDIETFFAYCKAKGLKPWDVYFIKYKNEVSKTTTKEGFNHA